MACASPAATASDHALSGCVCKPSCTNETAGEQKQLRKKKEQHEQVSLVLSCFDFCCLLYFLLAISNAKALFLVALHLVCFFFRHWDREGRAGFRMCACNAGVMGGPSGLKRRMGKCNLPLPLLPQADLATTFLHGCSQTGGGFLFLNPRFLRLPAFSSTSAPSFFFGKDSSHAHARKTNRLQPSFFTVF